MGVLILRFILVWLAKDYCLIIPGIALTLSLLRLSHPLVSACSSIVIASRLKFFKI